MTKTRSRPGAASTTTFTALVALLGHAAAFAQVTWQPSPYVEARFGHALAHDMSRGRTVLFGGSTIGADLDDTWEWDGNAWARSATATRPVARTFHALAYDAARGRVVLFGGNTPSTTLNDTWEYDGRTWTRRAPAASPEARMSHALAYDLGRGRLVLFGGWTGSIFAGDTWEWDGSNWIRRTPPTAPPPRWRHALAYDLSRQRVVLFGGEDNTRQMADTWEWDGTSWTQIPTAGAPTGRASHTLVYDHARSRVVLFGGVTGSSGAYTRLDDTWEWDGFNWIRSLPRNAPSARLMSAAAYDFGRQRVVLHGGTPWASDTWEWDGTNWSLVASTTSPVARDSHALAADSARRRVVLFGGAGVTLTGVLDDTWEWDGARWSQHSPATSPPARSHHALAYDAARQRVVLFGGKSPATGPLGDTWEWDGITWVQRQPASSPRPREGHALAFDAARGRVVLFGGSGSTGPLGDTWEWDGSAWTQLAPAPAPSARARHGLAYDSRRGRVVLFGGTANLAYPTDTWEWDGSAWSQRTPSGGPPGRESGSLTYDVARNRTVLFGGFTGGTATGLADTWEWDGNVWVRRTPVTSPSPRASHAAAYDLASERVVLFAGVEPRSGFRNLSTWAYGSTNPAAYATFGAGCAGTRGTPALTAAPDRRPWIGDTFGVVVGNLPAGSPALLFLGWSRTAWGTIPLPLDLTGLGMPGCSLLVSAPLVFVLPNAAGSASWSVPICDCPELVGGAFYNQALVVDPPANALGAIVSNAGAGTIGAR